MKKFYALETEQVTELERQNQNEVRRLAGECMVILENDGSLPLQQSDARIALYGNGARHTVKGGTGSGDVNTRECISIEQGLQEAGLHVITDAWLDNYDVLIEIAKQDYMDNLERISIEEDIPVSMLIMDHVFEEPPVPIIQNNSSDMPEAEIAIYVLARNSGEGADRKYLPGDYLLHENELRNIQTLAQYYKKFILLLNVGGVIDTSLLKEIQGINSMVLIGQTGNIGGHVVADVLLGKTIPSGKLTDTWAMHYEDYPSSAEYSHRNGNLDDEYYKEGIYVGYRYFDTFGIEPAYCFGYGKGYTDFSYGIENVLVDKKDISINVKVKNIGANYTGREVIQVYVSSPDGILEKPYQELVGFEKTSYIRPGEEESLMIQFPITDMASYNQVDASWILEGGDYLIRVGNSSRNTMIAAVIHLNHTVKTKQLKNVMGDDSSVEEIRKVEIVKEKEDIGGVKRFEIDASNIVTEIVDYQTERPIYENRYPDKLLDLEDVRKGKVTIQDLVAQLTVEELAGLCVGAYDDGNDSVMVGSASTNVLGAAGETISSLYESRKIPNLILADGPAGLRLYPHFITDIDGKVIFDGEVFGMDAAPMPNDIPENAVNYYQYCTAIPIACTMAQSWDKELIESLGHVIGSEMKQFHVHLWLAPGMNIHRNPLCGRNFEYYSEDPLLSGKCAAAETRGVQAEGGQGTTIKHYAANNQEDNRLFNNVHVSERTLREIYLRGFEIAVKESQPYSIMTSYNLINGIHAANHYGLLQSIARDEWNFAGVVMTDWFTSQDVSCWGFASDVYPISSSVLCIKAGNDLQMPGCKKNVLDIIEAVKNGQEITLGDLQFCAVNVLKIIMKCTELENQEEIRK